MSLLSFFMSSPLCEGWELHEFTGGETTEGRIIQNLFTFSIMSKHKAEEVDGWGSYANRNFKPSHMPAQASISDLRRMISSPRAHSYSQSVGTFTAVADEWVKSKGLGGGERLIWSVMKARLRKQPKWNCKWLFIEALKAFPCSHFFIDTHIVHLAASHFSTDPEMYSV